MPRLVDTSRARRLLWLNHESYSARLLASGEPPWLDSAACVAWMRQAQGLLGFDVLTLPLAEVVAAWLARDLTLRVGMGEKMQRAHLPLKTCLASVPLREHLMALASALSSALPAAVFTLVLPSPRDWTSQSLTLAGGAPDTEVDEDMADAAASCIADFLRSFAATSVGAVMIRESRVWEAGEPARWIDLYQPIANVARHYGWDWGVQLPAAVADEALNAPDFAIAPAPCGRGPTGLIVPERFWQGCDLEAPEPSTFDVADIPASARPETVLERLVILGKRQSTW